MELMKSYKAILLHDENPFNDSYRGEEKKLEMADEIVILHTALTCTLTLANLLFNFMD